MQHTFLPTPLAPDVLATLALPVTSLEEATAKKMQVDAARLTLDAALDTVESALQHNHADYLGGRPCWTYEQGIDAKDRVRVMKRQRQHLQEMVGTLNRALKDFHFARERGRRADTPPRAVRFMAAAERLLAPETYQLILDSATDVSGEEVSDALR